MFIRFGLIFLFCAGCQKVPEPPRKTLRTCFAKDPATIDPRKSSDFISSTMVCLLFEGLTRCKGGSEIALALAEKVDISSNGTMYVFSLRRSFWTDGRPVTAFDFERSWKTALTPGFPSPSAYLFYPIKNAERYSSGLCSAEEVGIKATGDQTLIVELETATPYFLSLTAFPLYLPAPPHADRSFDENTVCNGPFRLREVRPGNEFVLQKNDAFWDPDHIFTDVIRISILPDEMTAIRLFEQGELDIVGGPLLPIAADTPEMQNNAALRFIPMAASTFCAINSSRAPFSDPSFREAFAKSLREEASLVQEVESFGQIPAKTLLPPSLHTPLDALPAACKTLPHPEGQVGSVTLYYKANAADKRIARILQKIWADTLGIKVEIEQVESKFLTEKLHAKDFQIALTSWIAQYPDPLSILERFKDARNPKNYSGWSDERYQDSLQKAAISRTSSERLRYLSLAEHILQEQRIIIPVYHWRSPILVHPRVKGLVVSDSGGLLIEQCSLEEITPRLESSSPRR